jgi:hypothetical protein
MPKPLPLGSDSIFGRHLFHLGVQDLGDLPSSLSLPSKHFALLLAWDARGVPDQVIREFAQQLIDEGLRYLCAWGPECERVHDLFDQAVVEKDLDASGKSCVMTTWHDKEPLREALWYFLCCTCPDEAYANTCNTGLAISVRNDGWDREIVTALADPQSFNQGILKENCDGPA